MSREAMVLLVLLAGPALAQGRSTDALRFPQPNNASTGDFTVPGHLSGQDAGFNNVTANSYTATEPDHDVYIGQRTGTPTNGAIYLTGAARSASSASLFGDATGAIALNSGTAGSPTILRNFDTFGVRLLSGNFGPEVAGGITLGSSSLPWGAGFLSDSVTVKGPSASGRYLASGASMILASDTANAPLQFWTHNGTSVGERWSVQADGALIPSADLVTNIGSTTRQLNAIYTRAVRASDGDRVFMPAAAANTYTGTAPDSATAIGHIFNTPAYTTAGIDIASFQNNSVKKLGITKDGKINLSSTDATGTPGAVTINQPAFRVAIAAAASSVVVTNSLVVASSIVNCNLQTSGNATLTHLLSVVPGAGTVTINANAAATATAVNVGCVVFN